MQERKEIQYLKAARDAISSGQIRDAMSLYAMAFEENPENHEAKYFSKFADFVDNFGTSGDVKYPFLYTLNSLEYAIKYVSEYDCSDYEKSVVITTVISTYNIIFQYIVEAYNILGVDLIDDYIIGLYWLGSYINDDFQGNDDLMAFAADPWEKAIELHQEYGCKYEKYKVEAYAKKLKKIKPEYVVPEKTLENVRERKAREEAEKAEQRAHEEAAKAEQKAREEAAKAEQAQKDKMKLILIAAIFAAVVIIGGLFPYLF